MHLLVTNKLMLTSSLNLTIVKFANYFQKHYFEHNVKYGLIKVTIHTSLTITAVYKSFVINAINH